MRAKAVTKPFALQSQPGIAKAISRLNRRSECLDASRRHRCASAPVNTPTRIYGMASRTMEHQYVHALAASAAAEASTGIAASGGQMHAVEMPAAAIAAIKRPSSGRFLLGKSERHNGPTRHF